MASTTLRPRLRAYRIQYVNRIPEYVDVDCLAFGALLSSLSHEDVTVMPYFPFTLWHDRKGFVELDWEPPEPWQTG